MTSHSLAERQRSAAERGCRHRSSLWFYFRSLQRFASLIFWFSMRSNSSNRALKSLGGMLLNTIPHFWWNLSNVRKSFSAHPQLTWKYCSMEIASDSVIMRIISSFASPEYSITVSSLVCIVLKFSASSSFEEFTVVLVDLIKIISFLTKFYITIALLGFSTSFEVQLIKNSVTQMISDNIIFLKPLHPKCSRKSQ